MENKRCVSCGMEYPNHKMSCKDSVKEYRLPTAEEVLIEKTKKTLQIIPDSPLHKAVILAMTEFAKLHVEAALKEAEYVTEEYDFSVEIKNSYPLDKIK